MSHCIEIVISCENDSFVLMTTVLSDFGYKKFVSDFDSISNGKTAFELTNSSFLSFPVNHIKMSSRKTAGRRATTKKRAQRATSNVFAMFDQAQIAEFKEAFNMIDQNRDGFVEKEDLHDMLASLGKNPTDDYLEAMMNEAPGPINFTMFLTLFGERLQGTDPEDVIKNAFGCFDEENGGLIPEDRLRELLTTMGDRFSDEDVDEMYREAPIKNGLFDYIEFTRILKHGAKEKDEQ